MKERVHFPGVLAPATQYLADMCVFVLTSSEEGTSNALLEAMMIGVPVVCSDIPSNRQVVTNGVDGLLVDATSEQLANGVLELLQRGPRVTEMVLRAKEHVAMHYRLDVSAAANAALYAELIASRRERRRLTHGVDI